MNMQTSTVIGQVDEPFNSGKDFVASPATQNRNFAVASKLASRGIPVFPCRPNKRPYTGTGFKAATTDLTQIADWWTQFPDALPGMPTGAASGQFVIDVDVGNGKTGADSLASLEMDHEALPTDHLVQTPSGGWHYYFSVPAHGEVRNSTSKIGSHIDVRGEGGYVIAEGAVLPDGRAYTALSGKASPPPPSWLITKIAERPTRDVQSAPSVHGKVAQGQRNSNLTSYAGSLRRRGHDAESIERFLKQLNKDICSPPLDDLEVSQIARSIGQYDPTYTQTHLGNSERFRDKYRDELRYSTAGHWKFWDGTRWFRDNANSVQERAKQLARDLHEQALALPDPSPNDSTDVSDRKKRVKKEHLGWAKTTQNNPTRMIDLAASDAALAIDEVRFDAAPYFLNVQNGTVNLRTGVLQPHDREQLITKTSAVSYDAEGQCPRWISFLDKTFKGDQELIGFVQKLYGMALTGDTSAQVLSVLYGSGKNGKSAFAAAIQYVAGEYVTNTRAETFMLRRDQGATPEVAALKGARMVFASESGENRRLDAAQIKELTGGDRITARRLYEEPVTFEMQALITLITNHLPRINGADFALLRRVLVIPFEVTVPEHERDPNLLEKLKHEASGILAWLVEGCIRWQRDGLVPPEIIKRMVRAYALENDPVGRFIASECAEGDGLEVSSSDLWRAYLSFTSQEQDQAVTIQEFSRAVSRRFQKKKRRGGQFFTGLALRNGGAGDAGSVQGLGG